MISQTLAHERSHIFSLVRRFFTDQRFLEVDTPSLVRLPGMEPYLDVFKTRFEPMSGEGSDLYLITSPEYALKRLLADGYEKIFQITKCFRNKETGGPLHNPEFTMIEWYRTQANYLDIIRDTTELLQFLVRELFGGTTFVYQGREIDVSRVEIITMQKLFEKYTGISKEIFEDEQLFRNFFGEKYRAHHAFDDLFFLAFLNQIEPHLGFPHPVMITEYPASMAALARLCPGNSKYAERTELYIAGMEFANGFSELNDAVEQRRRLEEEREHRRKLGKLDYPLDEKFLAAVGKMPESSGIALGVDRLIMLLLDAGSIQEVVFFPFEEL
ncbi:MAG: EF-P lysine aminoacylase EpmA [Patescibacteria group bacterium]